MHVCFCCAEQKKVATVEVNMSLAFHYWIDLHATLERRSITAGKTQHGSQMQCCALSEDVVNLTFDFKIDEFP